LSRAASFRYPSSTYNRRAPERVVPRLVELFAPASVVDVGCGLGTWLAGFRDRGVTRLLGIDQSLSGEFLLGPAQFRAADFTRDLNSETTFDLALCLEVAEHLPQEAADRFVESLCRLAPTIVFSAAIPGQGGDGHCNEQWPAYWWNKFAKRGYAGSDALRWEFWDDGEIDCWYRQNLLVFSRDPSALQKCAAGNRGPVPVVHPELWRARLKPLWSRALKKARWWAQSRLLSKR